MFESSIRNGTVTISGSVDLSKTVVYGGTAASGTGLDLYTNLFASEFPGVSGLVVRSAGLKVNRGLSGSNQSFRLFLNKEGGVNVNIGSTTPVVTISGGTCDASSYDLQVAATDDTNMHLLFGGTTPTKLGLRLATSIATSSTSTDSGVIDYVVALEAIYGSPLGNV